MTFPEPDTRTAQFHVHRTHLTRIAQRMLGSTMEADDAVQEAWLRFNRVEISQIANPAAWLTQVITRICLDTLRARRRFDNNIEFDTEQSLETERVVDGLSHDIELGPLDQLLLAESLGLALQVVIQQLTLGERIAFVLHDLFDLPFDEIAPIMSRSPAAARQLASRGRRRIHHATAVPNEELLLQRNVVDAFLEATRNGDIDALLTLLDSEVEVQSDAEALPPGVAPNARGAQIVARRALQGAGQGHDAIPVLVNGKVGIAVAPAGRLVSVLTLQIVRGRITAIDVVAEHTRLHALQIGLLPY